MNPKIYWTNWRRNHVTTHVRIHVKSKKGGFLKQFSELLYTLTTYVTQTDEEKPQFCIKNEVENTNGLFWE